MPISKLHVLHGINTPSFFLTQVSDAQLSENIERLVEMPAGHTAPLFRGTLGSSPDLTFQTTQLATLLTHCGIYGCGLTGGNTDLYFRQATNLGTRVAAATGAHQRFRATQAFMYWTSLSVQHRQTARAQVRTIFVHDGTNAVLAPAGAQALAGTSSSAQHYTLGPCIINGTLITDIAEATLNLGTQVFERSAGGELATSYAGIQSIDPTITLRVFDPAVWNSYGILGTALTVFSLFLRKVRVDTTGGLAFLANDVEEHILLYGTAGVVKPAGSQAGDAEAMTGITIELRAPDTATDPLLISTVAPIVLPS